MVEVYQVSCGKIATQFVIADRRQACSVGSKSENIFDAAFGKLFDEGIIIASGC